MKGFAMSNWIGIYAIFVTIFIGLLSLWALGNAQRKKHLYDKIEKYNEILHQRIDDCEKAHVHEELCAERSGNIKSDLNNIKKG